MRHFLRSAGLALGLFAALASCSSAADRVIAPELVSTLLRPAHLSVQPPAVGITQVYGGGGNSGATLKNDFIELFNPGAQAVNISGWSVQYASAAGSTWQVTNLSGTIAAGGYYLVQESAGAGGTVSLPTPDVSGGIAMSATAGKVLVARTTTALSGTCPSGSSVVDQISFGTAATNCGSGTTATLSNTNAALRKDSGCQYTGDLSADFALGAPAPRNSASATRACPVLLPLGPLDHVVISGPTTAVAGSTTQLSADAQDSNNQSIQTATYTWSSSDPAIATVDATGKVTGVAVSATPVTITVNATDNGITKTNSIQLTVNAPAINWIDVSVTSTAFPPGFQAQLFATARVASGGTIVPATFTFEALDPTIATILLVANTGIVTGVAASTTRPRFRITATAVGGGAPYQFTASSITIETPVSAPTSIYATNDEFGDPTPASASNPNDLLIVRPQYTLSYNQSRGTPNWVSYELDSRQSVTGQDRCNCFTADPLLPAGKQIFTSDYTNGGYDRGHMTRSFDRTAANVDNATTFYLTNIVPQQADLNQGVWAKFETELGDSAAAGRAVYIITGPLYSRSRGLTFIKNEGKIAIPDSTWKVAFIGPRLGGVPFMRGSVATWDNLDGVTVLAVNMPNVAGVRNDLTKKYLTTVDKIEQATGYDFLSLLPVAFQTAIEAGDRAPSASFTQGGSLLEGSPVAFDASASTDPDLGRTDLDRIEALSYAWTFGEGTTASGRNPTMTFPQDGNYLVTLTVTDAWGWQKTKSMTIAIANVAPDIASFQGATILQYETYSAAGSFVDPGADVWTGTVDYGDGTGEQALALNGKTLALAHAYESAGPFSVTVRVTDGTTTTVRTGTVTVDSPSRGIDNLSAMVASLGRDGALDRGEMNSLQAKLNAASQQLRKDRLEAPSNILGAFVNELQALVNSGRLSEEAAATIRAYAERVIRSLDAG